MSNIFKSATAAILAFSALSGCLSTAHTASGILTPSDAVFLSTIPISLRSEQNGGIFETGVGGVAYVTGINDTAMVAFAGLIPTSDVGPTVTTGSATYRARYQLDAVRNIDVDSSNIISGFRERFSGVIPLTADFDSGTMTGNSQHLRVDARITGNTLTGTTTHNGVQGTLDGLVGQGGTIGAYAGNSSTVVYAGGFVSD